MGQAPSNPDGRGRGQNGDKNNQVCDWLRPGQKGGKEVRPTTTTSPDKEEEEARS